MNKPATPYSGWGAGFRLVRYIVGMVSLENVYWPQPPRTLYFEKRKDGTTSNCRIVISERGAIVSSDDAEISKWFVMGADSEAAAVENVRQLSYVPAEDWTLPP